MENDDKKEQASAPNEPVDVEIRVNDVPLEDVENEKEKEKEEKENTAEGAQLDKSSDLPTSSTNASSAPSTPQLSHISRNSHTQKTPLNSKSRLSISTPRTPQLSNQRYTVSPEGKTFGIALTNNPVFLWLLCCLVPLAYLVIMFGVIPIGNRDDDFEDNRNGGAPTIEHTNSRFYHYWVFTCVVNPINMTVIGFLLSGTFLSCMGVMRPFRVHWSILMAVFVAQLVVFNLIVPFEGTFTLLGGASLILAYITTFAAIYWYETWKAGREWGDPREVKAELSILRKNFWQFSKVAITFLIFFGILLLYMWAYQHGGSGVGQKLLPFGMTIGVFIMRKVMLALTDVFPLDVAMLISGFWVENIYDMFQTMAYRNVKLPVNYISIFFTNALSLLANLVFLTDTWFIFRIWIKAYLPLMFTGKCCPYKLGIEPDESEDDNERGHSNNKIGYHRRQLRFLMYKLFSKVIAALFYLLLGTILRYGLNKELFPFASDSFDEYINSIQFSIYNLIFLVFAGFAGGFYVRARYRSVYDHFVAQRHTLTSRYMLGSIVALLIHNGIVAISMMMYFNQIYYVVREEDDDD